MLSRFFIFTLLIISYSCAHMRQSESIKDKDMLELVNKVQVEGEGRGRLSIDQHQYLFSFESALQENNDWILAASIPLHGEEAMVLLDLKKTKANASTPDSFELRIRHEINAYLKNKSNFPRDLGRKFIPEFRQLVRFAMAHKLGLIPQCNTLQEQMHCSLDDEKFILTRDDKQFQIKKFISGDFYLELLGENLTETNFSKTNFKLHSQKAGVKDSPILLFELFWK